MAGWKWDSSPAGSRGRWGGYSGGAGSRDHVAAPPAAPPGPQPFPRRSVRQPGNRSRCALAGGSPAAVGRRRAGRARRRVPVLDAGGWGIMGRRAWTGRWAMDLDGWLSRGVAAIGEWQERFGEFEGHPSLQVSEERLGEAFGELTDRLTDNYPFFHPSYAGQMMKPPHPAAVAGYLAAMLINPNNHALDGGPATARMEKEVMAELAGMLGMPEYLGHLTTSGTIANLEALFVARELHPGKGIAYSAEAHYTHRRMCGVLGIAGTAVPADATGRMDLDELDALLAGGGIGTVVATAGTTGLGAIDPVHGV